METVLAANAIAVPSNTPATQYLANFPAARDPVQYSGTSAAVTNTGAAGTPPKPSVTLYYSSTATAAAFLTPQTAAAGAAAGTAIWPSNGVAAGNWNSCVLGTCTLKRATAATTTGSVAQTIDVDYQFDGSTAYTYTTSALTAAQGLSLGTGASADTVLLDRTKTPGWGGLFVYTCTYAGATALFGAAPETESFYFLIG